MRHDPTIQPLYERYPDNAPEPFYVIKGHCIICALPSETAPRSITWSEETFRFKDCIDCPTHCRVERQPETEEEIAAVIEAACGSCVEAIRFCGTDPKILAKFGDLGYERLCDVLVRERIRIRRNRRCNEWRSRHAAWQFGSLGGAAIAELIGLAREPH